MLPFTIVKSYDNDLLHYILREINGFPLGLSKALLNNNLKLYLHKNEIMVNGLYLDNGCQTLEGRDINKLCQYDPNDNTIHLIGTGYLEYNDFNSTIIHELAHAIDDLLGYNNKEWSDSNGDMLCNPLDDYAALASCEQFAKAFEGYHNNDSREHWWTGFHTKKDVYKHEPKLFEYFKDVLFKEGGINDLL